MTFTLDLLSPHHKKELTEEHKYQCIYTDFPWRYQEYGMGPTPEPGESWGRNKGKPHYDLMSMEELRDLKLSTIARSTAIRLDWVTMPKLSEAIKVIEYEQDEKGRPVWTYRTCLFTWIKLNKRCKEIFEEWRYWEGVSMEECLEKLTYSGQGFYTRSNIELLLVSGRRNTSIPRIDMSIRQPVYAPLQNHSEKPDIFRQRIKTLFGPLKTIELFARKQNPPPEDWDATGYEWDGKDIREFLNEERWTK